jgi:hypothetical protein
VETYVEILGMQRQGTRLQHPPTEDPNAPAKRTSTNRALRRAALLTLFALGDLSCASQPAPFTMPVHASTPEQRAEDLEREDKRLKDMEQREDDKLDELEKEAIRALKYSIGTEPIRHGQPLPYASSLALTELRKAKIELRIEPMVDAWGRPRAEFLTLSDSFTARVQELGRRSAEGKLSRKEMTEIQAGAKYTVKLNDLRSQVMQTTLAAYQSNLQLSAGTVLHVMYLVSDMTRTRRYHDVPFSPEDHERVRRSLERLQRAQGIASATMTMIAAYQATINSNGDPEALDAVAKGLLQGLPVAPTVTVEEAKTYVDQLHSNIADAKQRYEDMLRESVGDDEYDKKYRANVDAMFAHQEDAAKQKSAEETARDMWQARANCARGLPYRESALLTRSACATLRRMVLDGASADAVAPMPAAKINSQSSSSRVLDEAKLRAVDDSDKCARGQVVGAESVLAGAPCEALHKAALAGTPVETLVRRVRIVAAASQDDAAILQNMHAIVDGDVLTLLDSAGELFPSDGPMRSSLKGITAIARGDAKGALDAALNLVPGGGVLKDGVGLAIKVLGGLFG